MKKIVDSLQVLDNLLMTCDDYLSVCKKSSYTLVVFFFVCFCFSFLYDITFNWNVKKGMILQAVNICRGNSAVTTCSTAFR